jgi:glycosyltransferase involved in cell wall biosynthesis
MQIISLSGWNDFTPSQVPSITLVGNQAREFALNDLNARNTIAPGRQRPPLHVLHVIEGLSSGGAERLLYTNLKHLDGRRFRNTVATVFEQGSHWRGAIEEMGIEVINLHAAGYRSLPRAMYHLYSLLQRLRPDLLHTHLWAANIIGRIAGRAAGIPVISSIHNPEYEPEAMPRGRRFNRVKWGIARELDRLTARIACDRMIAVSNYVKQSTIRRLGYSSSRIDRLYNPIDNDQVAGKDRIDRTELLKQAGIPQDALVLLNVGRVSPQKGLLYAVRALAVIRPSFPRVHLVSVGAHNDSAHLAEIRAEIAKHDLNQCVHLLGVRRDIENWLNVCQLFVFPSLFEGLGIALIEAMAAGCPCVAANIGPIPELIRNGVNGILVEPSNSDVLAREVCELLNDSSRCKALGEAARITSSKFHPADAANELGDIYEGLQRAVVGNARD